jgi:hypothetical protein
VKHALKKQAMSPWVIFIGFSRSLVKWLRVVDPFVSLRGKRSHRSVRKISVECDLAHIRTLPRRVRLRFGREIGIGRRSRCSEMKKAIYDQTDVDRAPLPQS